MNGLYQTNDMALGKEMIFGGGIKYALKTLFGSLDMILENMLKFKYAIPIFKINTTKSRA